MIFIMIIYFIINHIFPLFQGINMVPSAYQNHANGTDQNDKQGKATNQVAILILHGQCFTL